MTGSGVEEPFGDRRRDFLRKLGGAIGVAIAADVSGIADLAEAAGNRHSKLPSGHIFHPVITADQLEGADSILPVVMINDRSELIFQTLQKSGGTAVYRMRIGRQLRPTAGRPKLITRTGRKLGGGLVVDDIGTGDTNESGLYVTTIGPRDAPRFVYRQRPGERLKRLLGPADVIPGTGTFSGYFGDVDVGPRGDILLVATYAAPNASHQGLFWLPRGKLERARLLIRTGQRVPDTRAVITRLGLVERSGPHFILQVFGRRPKHLGRSMKSEPSAFIVGRVAKGRRGAKLLVADPLMRPKNAALKGEALVGPRVAREGTAATVVHRTPTFLSLHRHRRGRPTRIAETGSLTQRGERGRTVSAPLLSRDGLLYYRLITRNGMELFVVDAESRRSILQTGHTVGDKRVALMNTGWHTDQVDRDGRLAFQVEMHDESTAIVIGTPV